MVNNKIQGHSRFLNHNVTMSRPQGVDGCQPLPMDDGIDHRHTPTA